MSEDIVHDPDAKRFVLSVGGASAHLDYVVRAAGARTVWDAVHTFVPPEARGQGAADRLVRAFVAAARGAGADLRGSCSYVGAWLARHPDA
ncbi:MAG: GNAT family N-acetyltransferase [Planctomycetota bacterium]